MAERVIRIDALDNIVEVVILETSEKPFIQEVKKVIGNDCELLDHVRPARLYREFGQSQERGQRVLMLVDENGYGKKLPVNRLATWLYNADDRNTGNLILGNAVIVQEFIDDDIDIGGVRDDVVFDLLPKLSEIASGLRV